jgi:two-component system, NtrC family, sensor histidine kinase HydH
VGGGIGEVPMDIARPGKRAWLLAMGVVLIVGIHAILAAFISNRVGEAAVEREAGVAQEFLDSILRVQKSGGALFIDPGPSPALTVFANQIAQLPDLIRANIYSPDGVIRYSTQEGLTGVRFEERNPELDEAFSGELSAELETITAASKAEHLALPLRPGEAFIEAYVPVPDAEGKTLAVVEFYKRPGGLATSLTTLQRTIWLSALLAALAMIALLFVAFTSQAGKTAERTLRAPHTDDGPPNAFDIRRK